MQQELCTSELAIENLKLVNQSEINKNKELIGDINKLEKEVS